MIACKPLLTYWRGRKKAGEADLARCIKLQEEAHREQREKEDAQSRRKVQSLVRDPECAAAPAAAASAVQRPTDVPAQCKLAYDKAHALLGQACCLIFDTETNGFGGCVISPAWILAREDGSELASYESLWSLPQGERFDRVASKKSHKITEAQLRRGTDPKPELAELFCLLLAALAGGLCVAAHNASFDVTRLNRSANRHGLSLPLISSATMLCTMHNATKHCGLRCRGTKRRKVPKLKAPKLEELYFFLFTRKPTGRLHNALVDCKVTLACYMEGRKRKWW